MWRVEERRGHDALESIEVSEWRDLEARCASASPFQSAEWLIPWWTCFSHGELRVITVRYEEKLRALVPLVVEQTGNGNRVTLLGTGNTDHLDMLTDDRCREVATAMALDVVAQALSPSDWCEFEQLPESSPLLTTPAPFGWRWELDQCDVCPTLAIASCAGDPIPPRRVTETRSARRRISRLGQMSIEAVRHDALDEALCALFTLHQARWQARGDPGVLGSEAVRRFLRLVAEGFLGRDMLRLYMLRLDQQIVAVHFGFQWRGRRAYYIGGFDPRLRSFSVGSVLLEHAIRHAADEGATEFDFLRGAEDYKYHWGARERPSFRRVLRRPMTL
jgi:CelD/BcsL family acetyltransferase involved in cellulose biosynthesis